MDKGSCCGSSCMGCKTVSVILCVIFTLLSLAALVGIWRAHMSPVGLVFGTPEGSLAIIAGVAALVSMHKVCKKLCPCRKGACAGTCPGCNHSPCTCK